jgi:hypothetical protein
MKTAMALLGVLAWMTAAACSDDDGGGGSVDAGVVDAAVVDAQGVSDARDFCADYCACMPTNCPTQFSNVLVDQAGCLATCQGLTVTNQDCRSYHCSMATGAGAALHCPHTIGQGECVGN